MIYSLTYVFLKPLSISLVEQLLLKVEHQFLHALMQHAALLPAEPLVEQPRHTNVQPT